MRIVLYRGSDICLKLLLLPQLSEQLIRPLATSSSSLELPDASLPLPAWGSSPVSFSSVSPWSSFSPHSLSCVPLPEQFSFSVRGFKQPGVSKNPLGAVEGHYWVWPLCNQQKLCPGFISKNLPEFLVFLASICTILACKLPRQVARSVRTNLLLVGLKSLKIRGFR